MRPAPPFRSVDQMFMGGSSSNQQRDAGKLRMREAYARILDAPSASSSKLTTPVLYIVPDALAWRTYLPWITHILQLMQQQQASPQHVKVKFVLLESVVHDLELRNQYYRKPSSSSSSRDDARPAAAEVAFPQERIRLSRLVQEAEYKEWILAYCDMSVRDVDFDEWQDLQHLPQRQDRARLLALRAARFLRHTSGSHQTQVYLWWHEKEASRAAVSLQEDEEEGVQFVEPHSLLQLLQEQKFLSQLQQASVQENLDRLRLQCQEQYDKRQRPKEIIISTESTVSWTEADMQTAVQNGTLGRGRFQVSKENPSEAFVSWKGTMWFVAAASSVHAIDQDIVIVQPLPESEWQQPVGRRRLVAVTNNKDDDKDDETVGTTATSSASSVNNAVPTARAVHVDKMGTRRVVVATLTDEPAMSDEAAVLVVPMDMRIPKIRLQTKEWQKWTGQRLLVQIDAWEEDSKYPAGHVQEILGAVGELETEIACLLHEHRIPMDPWSLSSRACLPREDWTIPREEINNRRDLRRTHNIFSVDPAGCQDIDDCMHARRLPNGDVEVGVHIADVTHFVPLNSPLDLQARRRGTTFYLVDRRFDMLPSVLSSNLCSLHGGTDRLAVSVIWTLTEDLSEILSTWYGRTVIHNVAAMTYEQADRILAGKHPEAGGERAPPPLTAGSPVRANLIPKLHEDLSMLTRLARQRRQDRKDYGGAVDLSSGDTGSELKFTLVNGEPVMVQPKQTKEIHRTIEELMIFANTSVASKIKETYPDAALLRIHRAVDEENFDDLKSLLSSAEITFKGKTNAELAESLQRAQDRSEKTVASLFRSLATRAMSEALYVSTGSIASADRLVHYGLGLKEYTHFTSPIRRYADVIVHHQLLSALKLLETSPYDRKIIAKPSRSPVLARLPESKEMSVLGAGLAEITDDEEDFEIDQLIGDAGEDAVLVASESSELQTKEIIQPRDSTLEDRFDGPFRGSEVAGICDHLNEHNRLAKHSSKDCQGLFLSMYFRNHVEVTEAVVTDLRENGIYCYIPKFDMRGPVFLRDMDGNVQIDPAFFNLPRTAGSEPSRGFASAGFIRRFDPSECEIWYKENEKLEIFIQSRSFSMRPLDVAMVSITCPEWDNRARVPSPRIQLIHQKSEKATILAPTQGVTSKQLSISNAGRVDPSISKDPGFSPKPFEGPSLFDFMQRLPEMTLSESSDSHSSVGGSVGPTNMTVPGRLAWGGFVNPDTRSAAQAAAQEAAAALRNERPLGVNEYDANNRVAREVTSRQQRKAAEKRNARRSKRS